MTLKEVSIIAGVGFNQGRKDCNGKFMFSLFSTEIKDGGLLVFSCGRGRTRTMAKKDYAKQLCGKRVVIRAYSSDRLELLLPPKITA